MSSIPELMMLNGVTQEIVDNKALWKLNGDAGEYKLTFDYNTEEYTHSLLITSDKTYNTPEKVIPDSKLKKIVINNKVVHPFGETFNIWGWFPGWLATYIALSLVLSMLFRKVLDVY
jgi:uncharacterized membrane protein (DUF106 family)